MHTNDMLSVNYVTICQNNILKIISWNPRIVRGEDPLETFMASRNVLLPVCG